MGSAQKERKKGWRERGQHQDGLKGVRTSGEQAGGARQVSREVLGKEMWVEGRGANNFSRLHSYSLLFIENKPSVQRCFEVLS